MLIHEAYRHKPMLMFVALSLLIITFSGCAYFMDSNRGYEGLGGPYFGCSVSLYEDMAIIGAKHGAGNYGPGLAYIFEQTPEGLVQSKVLFPEDGGQNSDDFGGEVALYGDHALVTARFFDGVGPTSGTAYMYKHGANGWEQTDILVNYDSQAHHVFGSAAALSDRFAVVGASSVDSYSGAVYIWELEENQWVYREKIHIADDDHRALGSDIAIDGDILAVCAHNGTANSGTVFVFRLINGIWEREASLKLKATCFGINVDVCGETLLVGGLGRVYIFESDSGNWTLSQTIESGISNKKTSFGVELALNGNTLVIGDMSYDNGRGAAFIYERSPDGWRRTAMIMGNDTRSDSRFSGRSGDSFGCSVAIEGDNILVGADYHDSEGPNYGAAYMFERKGLEWVQESRLVANIPPALRDVSRLNQ